MCSSDLTLPALNACTAYRKPVTGDSIDTPRSPLSARIGTAHPREPAMAHLGINGNNLFDLRETAFETLEHM